MNKFVLNPISGQLDLVNISDESEIVTHTQNSAGNPLSIYDPTLGVNLAMGPLPVTDNNGNLLRARVAPIVIQDAYYDGGGASDPYEDGSIYGGSSSSPFGSSIVGGGA
jgi:hypothetical protein